MFRYWFLEAPRGVDMSSNQISSITIEVNKYYNNIVAKRNIIYLTIISILIIIITTDIIIWIKFDFYLYIPFEFTVIIYASCNFETFRFY